MAFAQRMPPVKPLESRVVQVRRDPFTAGLDGKSREEGIRDQIAGRMCLQTKSREELPVPAPRDEHDAVVLPPKRLDELEGSLDRCRVSKDSRMCDDPEESREDHVGEGKRLVTGHDPFQPLPISLVVLRVLPESVN